MVHKNNKLFFRYYYKVSKLDKITKYLKHAHIGIVYTNFLDSHLVKCFSSVGIGKIDVIKVRKSKTINRIENLTSKGVDLLILFSAGNESNIHEKINELCIKNDIPLLTSRLFVDRGEIGPFVIPHKTACYMCHKQRIESNLLDSKNIENKIKRKTAILYPIIKIFSGYIFLEGLNFLTSYETPLTLGNLLIIDFKKLKTEIHPILKVPYCPVCGRNDG